MIKKLIFTAALLVPSLAYGNNPSANLTVQVKPPLGPPNSIACDIGPPYTGSIPAAAAQAGFTHCAANYDFTQTQSFTDSLGTHQWSNVSSWLACNAQSSGSWLWTYMPYVQGVPCNSTYQNVANDGGTQVLTQNYFLTNAQNSIYNNMLATANFVGPPPGIIGTTFPVAYYAEWVIKSDTNTCSSPCLVNERSFFNVKNNDGTNPCYLDEDYEVAGPLSSRPVVNSVFDLWNPVCGTSSNNFGPNLPTQLTIPNGSSYSTYGYLVTADNSSKYGMCGYYSSSVVRGLQSANFVSCVPYTVVPPSSAPVFATRNNYNSWEGPQSASQGGNVWTASSHTLYTQRITVWVCTSPTGGSWQTTGQCYTNPVITTHP
jgi:hypothetical protein